MVGGRAFAENRAKAEGLAKMRADAAVALSGAEDEWLTVSGKIEALGVA